MIAIIGASASGKTEISKILKKHGINKCITTTTREKREGEVDDIDYHFITKEEFIDRISKNEFIEYAFYNNNYYGINKADIKNDLVVVVEPTGANALISEIKNIFIVYIETNKDIRKQRMIDRNDKEEMIEKRLLNDDYIFKKDNINRIDLFIENNNHSLDELALRIYKEYKKIKK